MNEGSRLASLDAFRGFAIAAMVLVNNPGDWSHLYPQLAHAKWHGCTFTDWVFPFFLFISGVSMTLSTGRRTALGDDRQRLLLMLLRRAAVIFLVGLLLNLVPRLDFETVRIPGVLQRIALCAALAAPLVLWGRWPHQVLAIVGLFVAYTLPMLWWPVPDASGAVAAGVLEPGRDFGAWVDRALLDGHLWAQSRTWDPEGLVSTLPAVATLLFGVLAGQLLATPQAAADKSAWLMVSGVAALIAGLALDHLLMPINKSLWTPSYAVFTAGWALLAFGCFHWLLDAAPSRRVRAAAARGMHVLVIYGMNALFIFAFSGLVAKLMAYYKVGPGGPSIKAWAFAPLQALPLTPVQASLLWAVLFNLAMFGVAWFMWRRRWFIKA